MLVLQLKKMYIESTVAGLQGQESRKPLIPINIIRRGLSEQGGRVHIGSYLQPEETGSKWILGKNPLALGRPDVQQEKKIQNYKRS